MEPTMISEESMPGGETMLVALRGDFAYETAGVIRPRLRAILRAGFRRLVLDAKELEFLDSTGLSVLVGVRLESERAGGRVEIRNLHGQPARFLTMTGTIGLFQPRRALPRSA